MTLRTRLMLATLVLIIHCPPASAQGILGGAFIVSRLPPPGDGYVPGSVAVPPNGLTKGAVIFGGASLTPRVALQGEVSVPATLTTIYHSSHPSMTIEDTTTHRDIMAELFVRFRATSWLDLFAGGGADFERTRVTSVSRGWAPPPANVSEYTKHYSSNATRAVFTVGADLPIRLSRAFALLPTGRMHVVGRHTPSEPGIDSPRVFSPTSRYVFRFGIGGRVEF